MGWGHKPGGDHNRQKWNRQSGFPQGFFGRAENEGPGRTPPGKRPGEIMGGLIILAIIILAMIVFCRTKNPIPKDKGFSECRKRERKRK
jgi:hypothetical protein